MSTLILSLIIFGGAAYIIYRTYFKKNRQDSCHDCDCPAKPSHLNSK
ncbi:FeoB-associated Cys-rich membrane protein [Vagococcus sp. BWB3-3]|uniref:FeoB-associated Cys-rich membrane protein n=1 Tax=Vagococcus allomyrinae TaxID=2794353 RepID=A0A940PGD8_9ENTE|nr:FeoB-associated Cys-rich membrane protein [Vagococcus allomyrinae]MBP1044380.1 FeoB-associated Cys-rich membrane protein [Vagococcus allomyrinae]